jgi:mono/diheme cytochrome c family protein
MQLVMARIMWSVLALAGLALAAFFLVMPRLDWSAIAQPGSESALARLVVSRWVRRSARTEPNPLQPSPENLKRAQADFNEHCAVCHGLDGGGRNRLEADFYPRVPKLTGGIQDWSDGEIYFAIAKGVRHSGMPGFEGEHEPEEIWRIVLWVRHLAHLTSAEKASIDAEIAKSAEEHEESMGSTHGGMEHEHSH